MQVCEPMDSARERPSWSWTSAIMTLAPFLAKSRAVSSPIPLAPPVTMATLPCSFLVGTEGDGSVMILQEMFIMECEGPFELKSSQGCGSFI